MEDYIDLHTHSYKSDGADSPEQLIRKASAAGLRAVALTDHDTTDGIGEARLAAKACGIEFIPGIEISVISETETHIVGLYIDPSDEFLSSEIARSKIARKERNEETVRLLRSLGYDVSYEEAELLAGHGLVGRGHFANLLVSKGYCSSVKQAFADLLSCGKPAYSGNHCFTDREAIDIIHRAGGVAVLAHLHLIKLPDEKLYEYLKKLKGFGLDAIEGYYTDYTPEMEKTYRSFAASLGLILSGGSDYHGSMKPHISIGTGYGDLHVPYSLLGEIRKHARSVMSVLV